MFNFFNSSWDNLFFNYNTNNSENYDWNELKKKGTVEESVEEKDGFRTVTKRFTSFDGSQTVTSVTSTPIIDETKKKVVEIDRQIQEAVKKEDFETAAKLKKEKEQLIKKPKK
jgi:hypothetical protein